MGLSNKKTEQKQSQVQQSHQVENVSTSRTNPTWVEDSLRKYAAGVSGLMDRNPLDFVAPATSLQTSASKAAADLGGWKSALSQGVDFATRAGSTPISTAPVQSVGSTALSPVEAARVAAARVGAGDVGAGRVSATDVAAGRVGANDVLAGHVSEQPGVTAGNVTAERVGSSDVAHGGATGRIGASSLLDGLNNYLNPYLATVRGAALDDFDFDAGRTRAAQAASAAANGAFGGSRFALREAQTEGELARARAATDAGLLNQAWTSATDLSDRDAGRRQSAAMANQSAEAADLARWAGIDVGNADRRLNADTTSAQLGLTAATSNADRHLTADQFNNEQRRLVDTGNVDRDLTAATSNADRRLNADTTNEQFALTAATGNADRRLNADQFSTEQQRLVDVGNADRRLNADTTSAQMQLSADTGNADRALTAATGNADRSLSAQQADLARAQDLAVGNANRDLTARTADSQRLLDAGGLMGTLANVGADNARGDIATQLAAGDVMRGIDSEQRQAPLGLMQQIASLLSSGQFNLFNGTNVSGVTDANGSSSGTSTSSETPSLMAQIAQAVQTAAAAASLSDVQLKTDVQTLGHDDRGRRWVTWRYLWEGPNSPPHVGVIAQELMETDPAAVLTGPMGFLAVDYSKLEGSPWHHS